MNSKSRLHLTVGMPPNDLVNPVVMNVFDDFQITAVPLNHTPEPTVMQMIRNGSLDALAFESCEKNNYI